MAAIFHHANVRMPRALEHFFSRIIITPAIHWVHHRAVREDTDSNYGTILSVWDRVFHSRSCHQRTVDMVLGVEGVSENRVSRLVTLPFRRFR